MILPFFNPKASKAVIYSSPSISFTFVSSTRKEENVQLIIKAVVTLYTLPPKKEANNRPTRTVGIDLNAETKVRKIVLIVLFLKDKMAKRLEIITDEEETKTLRAIETTDAKHTLWKRSLPRVSQPKIWEEEGPSNRKSPFTYPFPINTKQKRRSSNKKAKPTLIFLICPPSPWVS